jgi:hypothetical protein
VAWGYLLVDAPDPDVIVATVGNDGVSKSAGFEATTLNAGAIGHVLAVETKVRLIDVLHEESFKTRGRVDGAFGGFENSSSGDGGLERRGEDVVTEKHLE